MKTLKLLFQGKMSKALFIMMMLFANAQTISNYSAKGHGGVSSLK